MQDSDWVLTIPEVAERLKISTGLAYRLARRDKLPVKVIRIGERRMIVSRKSMENLLLSNENKSEEMNDGK